MSWLVRVGLVAGIGCCLLAPPLSGGSKPKPTSSIAVKQEINRLLEAQSDAVSSCVTDQLGRATGDIEVVATININHQGQLLGCAVTVTPALPSQRTIQACVERVLRNLSYPKSKTPLISLKRSWRFSIQ